MHRIHCIITALVAIAWATVAHAEESAAVKVAAALPWDDILPLVGTGLVALIGWLLRHVTKLVQSRVKHEGIRAIVGRIDDAAMRVVRSVEQAQRKALAVALEDGVISEQDKKNLKAAAIQGVKDSIDWSDALAIFGSHKEVEAHVAHAVEAAVHKMQADQVPKMIAGTLLEAEPAENPQ